MFMKLYRIWDIGFRRPRFCVPLKGFWILSLGSQFSDMTRENTPPHENCLLIFLQGNVFGNISQVHI